MAPQMGTRNDHQVAILKKGTDLIAMDEVSDAERVVLGDDSAAARAGQDTGRSKLRHLPKRLPGARLDRAPARPNQRPLRLPDHPGGALDTFIIRLDDRDGRDGAVIRRAGYGSLL